jgi:hypothetical protein
MLLDVMNCHIKNANQSPPIIEYLGEGEVDVASASVE